MKTEIEQAIEFYWLELPLKDRSEIKKNYKKLSMIHHPDRWWKEENFKLLWKYKDLLEQNFYKLNTFSHKIKKEKEYVAKKEKETNSKLILAWYKIVKLKIGIFSFLNLLIERVIIYTLNIILILTFSICIFSILFLLPIWFLWNLWSILEPNYVYGIVNVEALSFTLKVIVLYIFIVCLYSIFYYKFFKKNILKYLRYDKLPNIFKSTIIYYFIFLYISVFIIDRLIIIIF